MKDFKKLRIWQDSFEFVYQLYLILEKFPASERFNLTDQLKRCSVSINSNIAEGASRNSAKDNTRFLQLALGSAFECETQILIASRLNFISELDKSKLLFEISKIQSGIVKYMQVISVDIKDKN